MRKIRHQWLPRVLWIPVAMLSLGVSSAEAQYLDPGAGSVILQAVIAVAVGLAATVKLYWHKISGFVSRRSKRNPGP